MSHNNEDVTMMLGQWTCTRSGGSRPLFDDISLRIQTNKALTPDTHMITEDHACPLVAIGRAADMA